MSLYCPKCQNTFPNPEGQVCPSCGTPLQEQVLAAGTVVSDFSIIREIGSGGMGIVYLAKQISLDRLVAFKVLYSESTKDREYVNAFFREARTAARLNHPNIVQAYDTGISDTGIHYFVMELIDGQNLDFYVQEKGKLKLRMGIDIAWKIARALEYAADHHLSHGDIKPENIVLTAGGEPKLADLGLARDNRRDKLTSSEIMATPAYAPPEVIRGELDKIGFKSDMYSFGATLYHLFAGAPPFPGDDPMEVCRQQLECQAKPLNEIRKTMPPALAELIGRMMSKSPAERPESWSRIVAEIENIRENLFKIPASSAEVSPLKKHAVPLVAGAAGLLLLIGAVAGFCCWNGKKTPPPPPPEPETPSLTVEDTYEAEEDLNAVAEKTAQREAKASWALLADKLNTMPLQTALTKVREYQAQFKEYAPPETDVVLKELLRKEAFEKELKKFTAFRKRMLSAAKRNVKPQNTAGIELVEKQINDLYQMQDALRRNYAGLVDEKKHLISSSDKLSLETYLMTMPQLREELEKREKQRELALEKKKQQEKLQAERKRKMEMEQKFMEIEELFRSGSGGNCEQVRFLLGQWEKMYPDIITEELKSLAENIRLLIPDMYMTDVAFFQRIASKIQRMPVGGGRVFDSATEKGLCYTHVRADTGREYSGRVLWTDLYRDHNVKTAAVVYLMKPEYIQNMSAQEQEILFKKSLVEKKPLAFYKELLRRCKKISSARRKDLTAAAVWFLQENDSRN